ncbi:hypothetical protein LOC51_28965 [Rubrivivax sp. JA1024]|nr:hypothetical protein [Rubrivivax sp. JA1024]
MPSDADYDAIREAFMETSRGRWFLNEYAKRNRNSDTTMVLDAVARIEQTLAAQKQAQAEAAGESLIALRAMVGEARARVAKAIAALDDTATLTAAHRGARAVSEVASTLRECGADARICDLLDQQVAAIEGGHRLVATIDRGAIEAAFDQMLQHVAAISGAAAEAAPAAAAAKAASPATADTVSPAAPAQHSPAPAASLPQAAAPAPQPAAPQLPEAPQPASLAAPQPPTEAALTMVTGVETDEVEFVETAEHAADEIAESTPATAGTSAGIGPIAQPNDATDLLDEVVALDAEAAEDDAVLDLVAQEMSSPEVSAPYRPEDDAYAAAAASTAEEIESDIAALQQALNEEIAAAPEPIPADQAPTFAVDEFAADALEAPAESERDEREHEAVASAEPDFGPVGEIGEAAPVAAMTSPTAASMSAASMPAAPMAAASAVADQAIAAAPASLGAAAIASGAVAAPSQMRSDTLVPFRRMSQSEKIAFFS